MLGPEAGEVMAAVQTAMLAGLPYTGLRDAILTHPTMAEGLNGRLWPRAGAVYPTLVGSASAGGGEAASEKGDSCGRVSRPCGNRTWAGRPRRRRRHKNGTPMTTSPSPRPPLPPFDRDVAIRKVRLAEDAWNTSFGRPVHRVRDDFRRAGATSCVS